MRKFWQKLKTMIFGYEYREVFTVSTQIIYVKMPHWWSSDRKSALALLANSFLEARRQREFSAPEGAFLVMRSIVAGQWEEVIGRTMNKDASEAASAEAVHA